MPQVIFAPAALRDLERLRAFLRPKAPEAAHKAGAAILRGVEGLGAFPRMGRLIDGMSEHFREWPIGFGNSGYIARYRIDGDRIVILAVRHQKEAGF
ncbi:type II toxin-antitoxin system RelE/ParE family toxin [Novosphingobium beihaiensis]|uniref:Type II toxin-antitoxin system RelE/ParE family toxin n=1 Tax=Novosphingobium beihaiensis TaxID=2930389 RepID=A0ABT0BU36_9SPHN|nr:type II toxin-antitoxin system RelE/ParE family toxin [Novosphingobium beihaiensis]MCJ2188341.1 type II toxin-antitoxin system RelE/ParE family toxin [Novosphingobium beihaiensis]